MLNPYNIKIKVFCKDENEARNVQNAITGISSGLDLIGSDLLQFYSKYKQNETVIKPVLSDVIRNGISSVVKHLPKLLKLK